MNGDELRFDAERIRKLTSGLTKDDIDRVLICLKSKEIEEQIRSNKVIEGVLRDIHAAIQNIADRE